MLLASNDVAMLLGTRSTRTFAFNPLQDNRILDLFQLQNADDNLNVVQMVEFVFYRVKDIFEKEESAAYSSILFLFL